jgi:DNA-binding transcriptional ArsR family regulator
MIYPPLFQSSPYVMPITWAAIIGALIWRGKIRSQWCKQGYDYDTFRLLARMKGSPIRVALLSSLTDSARTRSQLAEALIVDWKTIDNHIDVLAKNRLVQEIGSYGTSRFFAITEHGRRVLSLLMTLEDDNNVCSGAPTDIGRPMQSDSL